jgi:hypothetical protein
MVSPAYSWQWWMWKNIYAAQSHTSLKCGTADCFGKTVLLDCFMRLNLAH